jgi:DNA-binding NarL/FixJ family response regulator
VKTHLSHIFTKLDTTNRTQLAAAAIDRQDRMG